MADDELDTDKKLHNQLHNIDKEAPAHTETMMSSLRAFWRCLCATTNNAQARDVRNVPVGG